MESDRRNQPRYQAGEITIDISDGNGFYKGWAKDISRTGACLEALNKSLQKGEVYLATINTGEDVFRCRVMVKWSDKDQPTSGIKFMNPTNDWYQWIKNWESIATPTS